MEIMQTFIRPQFREEFNNRDFRRKEILRELAIFLFLIAPSMAFSFFISANESNVSFTLSAVSSILRDLALVALVLFFLWRNGEPVSRIGWSAVSPAREAAIGFGLFFPFFIVVGLIQGLLEMAGFSTIKTPPPQLTVSGSHDFILAFVMIVVVAVSEETIFRGYLISRFGELTRSPGAAILLSALVFSLGHGYEGSAGVVTVGIVGMIFGVIYYWRRSIIAPMVMHFMLDGVSILLLPLLK